MTERQGFLPPSEFRRIRGMRGSSSVSSLSDALSSAAIEQATAVSRVASRRTGSSAAPSSSASKSASSPAVPVGARSGAFSPVERARCPSRRGSPHLRGSPDNPTTAPAAAAAAAELLSARRSTTPSPMHSPAAQAAVAVRAAGIEGVTPRGLKRTYSMRSPMKHSPALEQLTQAARASAAIVSPGSFPRPDPELLALRDAVGAPALAIGTPGRAISCPPLYAVQARKRVARELSAPGAGTTTAATTAAATTTAKTTSVAAAGGAEFRSIADLAAGTDRSSHASQGGTTFVPNTPMVTAAVKSLQQFRVAAGAFDTGAGVRFNPDDVLGSEQQHHHDVDVGDGGDDEHADEQGIRRRVVDRTPELPVDWSIKTRVRFLSSAPFDAYVADVEPAVTSAGVTSFVTCTLPEPVQEDEAAGEEGQDTAHLAMFQRALLSFQYPAEYVPASLLLSMTNAAARREDARTRDQAALAAMLASRWQRWHHALASVWSMVQHSHCNHFYLRSSACVVVVVAATATTPPRAVTSRSWLAMRRHLADAGVPYLMPLVRGAAPVSAPSAQVKEAPGTGTTTLRDELRRLSQKTSFPPDTNGSGGDAGAPGQQRSAAAVRDHTPQSLLRVTGVRAVSALLDFLASALPRDTEHDVPMLTAPVAFLHASLRPITGVRTTVVRQQDLSQRYALDVPGPVMPQQLGRLCRLLQAMRHGGGNSGFSVSMQTDGMSSNLNFLDVSSARDSDDDDDDDDDDDIGDEDGDDEDVLGDSDGDVRMQTSRKAGGRRQKQQPQQQRQGRQHRALERVQWTRHGYASVYRAQL